MPMQDAICVPNQSGARACQKSMSTLTSLTVVHLQDDYLDEEGSKLSRFLIQATEIKEAQASMWT